MQIIDVVSGGDWAENLSASLSDGFRQAACPGTVFLSFHGLTANLLRTDIRLIARSIAANRVMAIPTHPETLFHLRFTEIRRPGKCEKNDLLAGLNADIMVHGHNLDAGEILDHRLHDWAGRFDQV